MDELELREGFRSGTRTMEGPDLTFLTANPRHYILCHPASNSGSRNGTSRSIHVSQSDVPDLELRSDLRFTQWHLNVAVPAKLRNFGHPLASVELDDMGHQSDREMRSSRQDVANVMEPKAWSLVLGTSDLMTTEARTVATAVTFAFRGMLFLMLVSFLPTGRSRIHAFVSSSARLSVEITFQWDAYPTFS
nr:hypothetical protein CFP56_48726 [Quercus suber]